jgi:hypothetical protein
MAVTDVLQKMAGNLMAYYTPATSTKGSIAHNVAKGPEGFQWYEGGVFRIYQNYWKQNIQ